MRFPTWCCLMIARMLLRKVAARALNSSSGLLKAFNTWLETLEGERRLRGAEHRAVAGATRTRNGRNRPTDNKHQG